MASKTPQADAMTEPCQNCGYETPHTVTVELRTESADDQNAAFSREPYRVATCRECGDVRAKRMNDA
ncbi:hypothetical protein LPA44_09320 [Halobacterium sp. KA-4]|jgi:uncharacterized Zn finger protein|uniref:DUF7835 family putative zinc beta-ribbon protein n=1 Tax=Halobacterium sp. KA-4 TaxID=2896367 RepID=UPI001E506DAB|nr:hypothetical protein [Halobacterium sp. KA-4]MCD2200097.1 hypothetical protein [Halobacterium sp. KA-4]